MCVCVGVFVFVVYLCVHLCTIYLSVITPVANFTHLDIHTDVY